MKKFLIAVCLVVFLNQISAQALEFTIERYSYAYPQDIAYNGTVFVAVSFEGQIMTSIDFETWNLIETKTQVHFSDVIWTGSHFIVLTNTYKSKYEPCIYRSNNGSEWEKISIQDQIVILGSGDGGNDVFYQKNNKIFVTSDFRTEKELSLPETVREIHYSNGTYLAVSSPQKDTIQVYESSDKVTWRKHNYQNNIPITSCKSVYQNGVLSLVMQEAQTLKICSSSDFENWNIEIRGSGGEKRYYVYPQNNKNNIYYDISFHNMKHIATADGIEFEEFGDDYQLGQFNDVKNMIEFFDEFAWGCVQSSYRAYYAKRNEFVKEISFPQGISEIDHPIKMEKVNAGYINEIDGKYYLTGWMKKGALMPDLPGGKPEYEFLFKQKNYQYIWTGQNYMAMVKYWASDKYQDGVYLYDEELNLVKEFHFGKQVVDISYYKNVYYCRLYSQPVTTYLKSNDFENWTKIDEEQMPNVWGVILGKKTFDGNSFYPIIAEDKDPKKYYTGFRVGEWMCASQPQFSWFSPDGVYFVKVDITEEWSLSNGANGGDVIWYETENDLIADAKPFLFKVSKQELYQQLHALEVEAPPYIIVENKVLSFEQPPVMESDRTLVPMRFLFENLGADVTWDESTQRATASVQSTAVTFGINDTVSEVNGQPVTMDVPARLINDQTFVPLRFLSEELGYEVTWDNDTRVVTIN